MKIWKEFENYVMREEAKYRSSELLYKEFYRIAKIKDNRINNSFSVFKNYPHLSADHAIIDDNGMIIPVIYYRRVDRFFRYKKFDITRFVYGNFYDPLPSKNKEWYCFIPYRVKERNKDMNSKLWFDRDQVYTVLCKDELSYVVDEPQNIKAHLEANPEHVKYVLKKLFNLTFYSKNIYATSFMMYYYNGVSDIWFKETHDKFLIEFVNSVLLWVASYYRWETTFKDEACDNIPDLNELF